MTSEDTDKRRDIERGVSSPCLSSSSSPSSSSENCSRMHAQPSLSSTGMHARDVYSSTTSKHVERTAASTSAPPTSSSTSLACHRGTRENPEDILRRKPKGRTPGFFHEKNQDESHQVAVSGEKALMPSERRQEKETGEITPVILENFEKMVRRTGEASRHLA